MTPRKVALVIGGTGILGRAIRLQLTASGWEVTGTARHRDTGARIVSLDLEDDESRRRFADVVERLCPTLIIDAAGAYTELGLDGDQEQIRTLLWVNSVAPAAALSSVLDMLSPGAIVFRIESSLGEAPAIKAPVVSAAKAADRALSAFVAEACRGRGLLFGSLVLSAVSESLSGPETDEFRTHFGADPPSAEQVAEVVEKMIEIMRVSKLSGRLLLPGHGMLLDPLSGAVVPR